MADSKPVQLDKYWHYYENEKQSLPREKGKKNVGVSNLKVFQFCIVYTLYEMTY